MVRLRRRTVPTVRFFGLVGILALSSSFSWAGSVDTSGPFSLVTGRLTGRGNSDALFLWDHVERKLAVYEISGETLKLLFSRNCEYDFDVKAQIGDHKPTVKEVREGVRKEKAGGKEQAGESAVPAPGPVSGGFTLALGKVAGFGDADVLYIFSHSRKRLAVYLIRGDVLELFFARDCEQDLDFDGALGKAKPEPKKLKGLPQKPPVGVPASAPKKDSRSVAEKPPVETSAPVTSPVAKAETGVRQK